MRLLLVTETYPPEINGVAMTTGRMVSGLRWLSPLVTRWLDALHRRCRATLVPAPELAQALSARGIPNVQVVGRGVDTGLFNPTRRSGALRRSWGLDGTGEQGLACLHVGRMAPEKNLEAVVRTYETIAARRPGTRMIWVGDGPTLSHLRKAHTHHPRNLSWTRPSVRFWVGWQGATTLRGQPRKEEQRRQAAQNRAIGCVAAPPDG